MQRVTFRDFRIRVAAYANSVGSPLGVCINNIPALAGLVNAATDRLLNVPMQPEEGWWGTWAKYVFNVSRSQPYITAPRGVARVIVIDICRHPVKVQNGFYEFLDFGAGLQTAHSGQSHNGWDTGHARFMQSYDRGSVSTLGTLQPPAQQIAVFPSNANDGGESIIIQGTDQNGNTVYGQDPVTQQEILGETLTMAFPFVLSVNQYSQITGLEKDVTLGPVTIMQQNPTTTVQQPLSAMEPSETAAAYRTYLIGDLPCQSCQGGSLQVTAQCKLDFVPVSSDSDYLVVPCIPALIAECECIKLESVDNKNANDRAATKHAKALSLLFGQLDQYLGKERPAITVPLFGSTPLRPQRI